RAHRLLAPRPRGRDRQRHRQGVEDGAQPALVPGRRYARRDRERQGRPLAGDDEGGLHARVTMKVLVLGAGVIGVTSAWYLAKHGHEVTLVDRHDAAGEETSFANGGQISVSHAA